MKLLKRLRARVDALVTAGDAGARGPVDPRLLPARRVRQRFRERGGDSRAALRGALEQLAGLRVELEDDARWARLVRMVHETGDVWNAEDWPRGFDPLVCAASLCEHVAFECARCPIGRRQGERSCAHPQTAYGRVGELVREGERAALRAHLDQLEGTLREELAALDVGR